MLAQLRMAAMWTAGVAGALCLLWLIVAQIAGLTLIVFTTGSMAPTAPAGAVALAQTVHASEVRVGDVITVQRDTETLPVTHRVVAIETTRSGRRVSLQGDANTQPDPVQYDIAEAKRMVAVLPGAQPVLSGLRNPATIAFLTVLVAGFVASAFWPTPGKRTSP